MYSLSILTNKQILVLFILFSDFKFEPHVFLLCCFYIVIVFLYIVIFCIVFRLHCVSYSFTGGNVLLFHSYVWFFPVFSGKRSVWTVGHACFSAPWLQPVHMQRAEERALAWLWNIRVILTNLFFLLFRFLFLFQSWCTPCVLHRALSIKPSLQSAPLLRYSCGFQVRLR